MTVTLNHDIIDSAPVPAATVVVLRDGIEGLEVLLVKRHSRSEVLGGAYVFPGGKLDEQDCQVMPSQLDHTPQELCRALRQDDLDTASACGLYVAALRETFEECNLLLHSMRSRASAQAASLRRQLGQGQGFLAGLQALGLMPLQTRHLVPWSRWISPPMPSMSKRRFDTRFFMALAPDGQQAQHDAREITETRWIKPADAIRAYWGKRMMLANVQLITLMELSRITSAPDVLAIGRRRRPPLIRPEPFDIDGQRVVCYPGDPSHSQKQSAWHGPTRMTFRNGRFEPEGGLQALLDA